MQMKQCIYEHLADPLRADAEAMRAVEEFIRNIPGRVMEFNIDTSKTNKQGILEGEKVYKLGVVAEAPSAFIEFYENRGQGEPTMALYTDKAKALLTIKGWQVNRKFYLAYMLHNGRVEKMSKLD